ncbi:MAG TPA: von Willebrand factor type A domain-containing protein [Thermoanaerobaculia bacterium]|nr:von Willebrand factor type A domain-containing protein [Thermoanaerobaculia bacterium]
MSRLSEREIARKLAERDELEPPAGLLEKIKSEIPPMIPAGTGVPEIDRRPSMPPRQRWLIAASLAAMAGASLFALHRMEVPPVEETARAAASLRQPAPPQVFFPPPPTVPPQRSLAQPHSLPDQAPAPKPAPPREQDALKPLGYVRQGEEKVADGAPGGVVGGLAGGEPAAAPAPPAALSELESRSDKKEAAAEAPARDEQRRSNLVASGNENLPRSETPAQEVAKPQAAARAKTAGADHGWKVPSPQGITLETDAGTASYDLARRSIAEGKLPDPAAIRVGEILNAFDTGDALRVEGAVTPFVQGPRYRLLRLHPFRGGRQAQARLSFNPTTVARYRLVGTGLSTLYEIELRPGASSDTLVATLRLGEVDRPVVLSELVPWDKASPGFRLAALAAEFAEILKGSSGDLAEIARQAREAGKDLPESAKATELAEMAEQVKGIREK